MLQECQNESGACNGLQPVGWPEYMYVQFISKEVLTRLNWILPPHYLHSHNIFGKNLWKVILTPGREVVSSERKHHRPRQARKCLPPEKKNKTLIGSKKEYSAFEVANTPYCQPVYMYLDAEVQTDSTASQIEARGKLLSFYRQIQTFLRRLNWQRWL